MTGCGRLDRGRDLPDFLPSSSSLARRPQDSAESLRISDFEFPSDFDLRISDLTAVGLRHSLAGRAGFIM
jgi:hypothetical protein